MVESPRQAEEAHARLSRRTFLGASALTLAATQLQADPLGLPIGCQTYPVREALGKDIPAGLKQLASMGYKTIEMCSPPGYEKGGYAPFLKYKASELKQVIHDAGLKCESSHYNFAELKNNLDDRIAFAKDLGLKQMILATFGLPRTATMSDWSKACDDLNHIGEQTLKAGIQTGFHNHAGEFEKIDGVKLGKYDSEGELQIYDQPPSDTAIIFYLKTKAKKRGYVERSEFTGADGGPLTWNEQKTYETKPEANSGP